MTEAETSEPGERTRLNVLNSDATLIVSRSKLTGGSKLTWQIARNLRKPLIHIDLGSERFDDAVIKTRAWIDAARCCVLNVAGPRESKAPGVYHETHEFLTAVFRL